MHFTHEYNEQANHRLVITLGHQVLATGEWASYRSPAKVQFESWTYAAFTAYFEDDWAADAIYTMVLHSKATTKEVQTT